MPLIPDGTRVGHFTVRRCVTAGGGLGAVYEVEVVEHGQAVTQTVNLIAPGTVLAGDRSAYTVTRFLAGGGFGQAYLAENDGRELVAKRYIHDDADADPAGARTALLRESQALAALRHPGLPEVIEYFAADEQNAFVVMTRMPGRPLDDWVAAARAADPDWWKAPAHAPLVLNWMLSLAEALGVLHNLVPTGLAHLDIKPENVLVRDDGKVSLIDFGAVRALGPRGPGYDAARTVIAFTPGFVAPEYEREVKENRLPTPTPACDVYSAGVLLRVMLTGADPRDDAAAVLAPLALTGVPLWDRLAEVAAKAHAFLPEERYASAADLTAALLELTGGATGGRAEGACRRCRRRTRRASVFCSHCGQSAWAELAPAPAAVVTIDGAAADGTRAVELLHQIGLNQPADLARFRLFQRLQAAGQDSGFGELRCLDQIKAEKLPHQTAAALTALRDMGGFALLADEVGLGKTIEAGIILKELVVRDLARRVLIIVPDHVLDQWQQELYQRFDEYFVRFGRDVDTTLAWKCPRLLVPYQVAEDRTQGAAAAARDYELVIFDEAHHLLDRDAQRGERLQRFARRLGQKTRRLLMLTATPMLSDLRDLHTLLTLLKPGSVGDLKAFL
ncbi:MAG TPA: SNF2-related protein, partial [Urbifossiella sp.]|nr:SNF2-related protein [Urbifossiella sp.]